MTSNDKCGFLFSLQGAMDVALGSAATGVFTNSDWLWEQLHKVLQILDYDKRASGSQLLC